MKFIITLLVFCASLTFAQQTPLETNEFKKVTSYEQLREFLQLLDHKSDILKVSEIGTSVEGRKLYGMHFSTGEFGTDESKIKVIFFAQQHGNEQSGKEGAIRLAKELITSENTYLFEKIDFLLVPQINPDGSEADKRFNANKMDLNRNHLILTEPETIALHNLFNRYKFEVSLDIHEYYPFTEDWAKFGFYKRADEQLGLTTNLNVSEKIRDYSRKKVLPFIRDELDKNGYSFNEYLVGGPPEVERARHSTVDIDDGRQSIGIQNTLSFILEGKNGRDSSADNIGHRALGQKTAMISLLKLVYENSDEIKALIKKEREELKYSKKPVVIRMEHIGVDTLMTLPVTNVLTGKDTVIKLNNYNPIVRKIFEKSPPEFYLIPRSDSLLFSFIQKHNIAYLEQPDDSYDIVQYNITEIDTNTFEEYIKADFKVNTVKIKLLSPENYLYIPLNQLKNNTLTLAFEPESMLGLVHYSKFQYLTKTREFPILRAERRSNE